MKSAAGALLAVLSLFAGGWAYGWRGVVFALTVIIFLLMLQFTRVMRVMRRTAQAPVGRMGNAVMVTVKLKAGMPLLEVLSLIGSLGESVPAQAHAYRWQDTGGDTLTLQFSPESRLVSWTLVRAS